MIVFLLLLPTIPPIASELAVAVVSFASTIILILAVFPVFWIELSHNPAIPPIAIPFLELTSVAGMPLPASATPINV